MTTLKEGKGTGVQSAGKLAHVSTGTGGRQHR